MQAGSNRTDGCSAAAYLAIGVPLVTCDAKLAVVADGVVEVELFRPAD